MTELFQTVIQRGIDHRLKITALVERNSGLHLLLLRMGMTAVDFPFSYIAHKYGPDGYKALATDTPTEQQFAKLLEIRKTEKIRHRSLSLPGVQRRLNELLAKMGSFRKDIFTPSLLSALEAPEVDFSRLGSLSMELSEMGEAEWKEAMARNRPIDPFNYLEHIVEEMTPQQKQRFKKVESKLKHL